MINLNEDSQEKCNFNYCERCYGDEPEEYCVTDIRYHNAVNDLKTVKSFLPFWLDVLNLTNWRVDIVLNPTMGHEGGCNMIYNDYRAIVYIKSELSLEEQEKTLVHELVHLIHRDANDIAVENLEEGAGKYYSRFHERAIEQMAKILYKAYRGKG